LIFADALERGSSVLAVQVLPPARLVSKELRGLWVDIVLLRELSDSHSWISNALEALLDSSHESSLPGLGFRSQSEIVPSILLVVNPNLPIQLFCSQCWICLSISIVDELIIITVWHGIDNQRIFSLIDKIPNFIKLGIS